LIALHTHTRSKMTFPSRRLPQAAQKLKYNNKGDFMKSLKAIAYGSIATLCVGMALPASADTTETKTVVSKSDGDGDRRTREDHYWQDNYTHRPYYRKETTYSYYQPAYHYGVEVYSQHPNRRFEDLDEAELRAGWEKSRGTSTIEWDQARDATRDA